MKLGLELITQRTTTLRLGTFFEMWLANPEGTVRRSLGRDEYHLGLTVEAERRIAATGRTHICQVDLNHIGLGQTEARPTQPVSADIPLAGRVIWGIRTNLFLDLAALTAGAKGRLVRDQTCSEFRLDHAHLVVDEVAPGRYIVDVSALLI